MTAAEAESEAANARFSGPNVEAVLRSFEAFNRGDDEGVVAEYTEDVEYRNLSEIDGARVFSGHDGLREWLSNARAIGGQKMRFDPTILALDGDVVMARGHGTGIAQGDRIPIEWTAYAVYDMRDRKIRRVQMFFDLAEAEAASGLRASE